ncbi:MAG: nucleoside deaminase [Candidatus Lokiarchaeota archaeon]|nr:nucleoside deaminase [Candidatus Lokiarchaeota archaeon]MBD3199841.1 nucleoside deaminase [Candidatus Lokiarchaeota archaeon]
MTFSKDELEDYMKIALLEAKISLNEGNNGFGTLIVKNKEIIAKSHDLENIDKDPTSHAEINAIRIACKTHGKSLPGCVLFSTHEPCPMCTSAIIWAGLEGLVYSVSIDEAIELGRKRIPISSHEIIERSNSDIWIKKGVLKNQCIKLYSKKVHEK